MQNISTVRANRKNIFTGRLTIGLDPGQRIEARFRAATEYGLAVAGIRSSCSAFRYLGCRCLGRTPRTFGMGQGAGFESFSRNEVS